MISIATCKRILQVDGIEYTDVEIEQLRDFLYTLADLRWKIHIEENMLINEENNSIISSTQKKIHEESCYILQDK